jgi:hypothetical protein
MGVVGAGLKGERSCGRGMGSGSGNGRRWSERAFPYVDYEIRW